MKIWFQNRRTKWKKQENLSNAEAAEHRVNGERRLSDSGAHSHRRKMAPVDNFHTPRHAGSAALLLRGGQTLLSPALTPPVSVYYAQSSTSNRPTPAVEPEETVHTHRPYLSDDSTLFSRHAAMRRLDVTTTSSCPDVHRSATPERTVAVVSPSDDVIRRSVDCDEENSDGRLATADTYTGNDVIDANSYVLEMMKTRTVTSSSRCDKLIVAELN